MIDGLFAGNEHTFFPQRIRQNFPDPIFAALPGMHHCAAEDFLAQAAGERIDRDDALCALDFLSQLVILYREGNAVIAFFHAAINQDPLSGEKLFL